MRGESPSTDFMSRRCSQCEVTKALKFFSGTKKTCRKCLTRQVVNYYARNSSYRRACKEGRRRRAEERQRFIYSYLLEHPCVDCGENDPLVLQFDHEKKKSLCVTSMIPFGLKRLMQEIVKCRVRCANCHSRKTAQRAKTMRWRISKEK